LHKRFHGFCGRSDESDSGLGARASQSGIFREKTVTGMNGIAAGTFHDIHDFVDAQITFARWRGANRVGFVGQAHVQGTTVGFAEYGSGGDAEFPTGAENAHGDFTAIGNENFAKQRSLECMKLPCAPLANPDHLPRVNCFGYKRSLAIKGEYLIRLIQESAVCRRALLILQLQIVRKRQITPPESIVADNVAKIPPHSLKRRGGTALTGARDCPIGIRRRAKC
jgi:hypothetical protein